MPSIASLLGLRLRQLRRVTVASHTLGYVENIKGVNVYGWAFNPLHSHEHVRVKLVVDGHAVAEAFAEGYRPDLEAQGYGDGRHGFTLQVPAHLVDAMDHTISVVDVGNGQRLVGLSRRYRLNPEPPAAAEITDLLFDLAFYRQQAGGVREPLDHYRDVGWKRGYRPHPLLDTTWYVQTHGLDGDEDPLTHFERVGAKAGLSTHPMVDTGVVVLEKEGAVSALVAYLRREIADRPAVSGFFCDADYAARHPGVVEAGFLPMVHYLAFGWKEKLRPHIDFDPELFGRLAVLPDDVEPYSQFVSSLIDKSEDFPAAPAPKASIIILNYNKALLTLQCLYFLRRFTDMGTAEVIVVDNGSEATDFQLLSQYARGVVVVRVNANRGFGEGCNIGAEHARGAHLVFMNNDVFVRPGWLEPLLRAVEDDPTVGAVGGKLLFADGSLQEAGAMVSACGTAVQRGKHLDPRAPMFNCAETVDYCSAALLLVRADSFRSVLGFDLCWDPAYYEDSDLCLKLRTIGQRTVYAPACEVVHLEHATTEVPGMAAALHDVVAVNRLKFVDRWSQGASPEFRRDPAVVAEAPGGLGGGSLALYSPYPLTPGGGERYLLTMAATLGKGRRCTLFTPDRYSRIRLLTVARELGLDLDHVQMDEFARAGMHERYDTFVCMGNEALPPVGGIGRLNVFHCQFPFPMDAAQTGERWRVLQAYDGVVVNSAFTADHYLQAVRRVGLTPPRVAVVAPPVPQAGERPSAERTQREPLVILSVGRFAPDGHCKRQDIMVQAFARLAKRTSSPVELHLAGTIGSDEKGRRYLRGLMEEARSLPVYFHPNVGASRLADLYHGASLYWHLTGAGQDVLARPELFEHFGISIVEAMSAGVAPLALGYGGPAEIIEDGVNGELLAEPHELVERSERLLSQPARLLRMSQAARRRAQDFSTERFERSLDAALTRFGGRSFQRLAAAE